MNWIKQKIEIALINVKAEKNTVYLNYFFMQDHNRAVLRNPEILIGNLITGTELSINLYTSDDEQEPEAELLLNQEDFLPEAFCEMLGMQPPEVSTIFGLISKPVKNQGRYYMLRDINADGLLLCTGIFTIKNGRGYCRSFDGQWPLRYRIMENFFYGLERPESDIQNWQHPSMKLRKVNECIEIKNLNKRFRNYAASWHRYNYFYSDNWTPEFYRKQARLGFIAITHKEDGKYRLVPQLQREYAVLDWNNLVIDKGVKRILKGGRIKDENIRLNIDDDPSVAIENLNSVWTETWITDRYAELLKQLAAEYSMKKTGIKIWGITLSAGSDDRIIAGELGYTIGKTYTSLSGFFHRDDRRFNNFGKLQMVMLAEVLKNAGIAFWNLGQPYMEYKLKLGASVVPRGLFLKRWDRAVRGRTIDLKRNVNNE